MALPSSRVLAHAVVAHLRYTTGADHSRDWDLPADLRPDAFAPDCQQPEMLIRPGLSTANLLGWNRATHLSTDQRVYIEDAGITNDEFDGQSSKNSRFADFR